MASQTRTPEDPLLTAADSLPVRIENPDGRASFLLLGDHAGKLMPSRLGTMGLGAADRRRHIAWDIGVAELGAALAARLDAPFVAQRYSRLVVDCNRAPDAADAIAPVSDGTPIPANAGLSDAARAARFAEVHEPYHRAIGAELARRDAAGLETVLVALHSFTPVMGPSARPWEVGVLHDRGDTRFALACLGLLRGRGDLVVGDNEPYRMDRIDYTVPRHAYPAKRPYVELEIRQDLLSEQAGVERWTAIFADVLTKGARALD